MRKYCTMDLYDKLEAFTQKTNMCWLWIGERNNAGYGKIRVAGKYQVAHRVIYEFNYRPIPKGMIICHRCDNPSCVRPDHLFLGTYSDNAKDAYAKGRLDLTKMGTKTRFKTGNTVAKDKPIPEYVDKVRLLFSQGTKQTTIANTLSISRNTVNKIVRNITYKP